MIVYHFAQSYIDKFIYIILTPQFIEEFTLAKNEAKHFKTLLPYILNIQVIVLIFLGKPKYDK